MNAEQLEALAGGANPSTLGMDYEEAIKILARRAIAAEKMVEAGNAMADAIEGGNPFSGYVGLWDDALTAYREASK